MLKFLAYTIFFATATVLAVAEASQKSADSGFKFSRDGTVAFL
jgi:hypothetical protein